MHHQAHFMQCCFNLPGPPVSEARTQPNRRHSKLQVNFLERELRGKIYYVRDISASRFAERPQNQLQVSQMRQHEQYKQQNSRLLVIEIDPNCRKTEGMFHTNIYVQKELILELN